MEKAVSDIVKRVYGWLGEDISLVVERMEYGDGSVDTAELVRLLLPETVTEHILSADVSRLFDCVKYHDTLPVVHGDNMTARAKLPADFMRLVCFRMSDWTQSLVTLMDRRSEGYQMRVAERGRFAGRIWRTPAIAISPGGMTGMLEIFGTAESSTTVEFGYIPRPQIRGLYIDIPAVEIDGVVRDIAQKIKEITGNS